MTLGEYRVGITFNPAQSTEVDTLKRMAADFIDLCEGMRSKHAAVSEAMRLLSLAQTHAEDAAMWAVKAVTKPPIEP